MKWHLVLGMAAAVAAVWGNLPVVAGQDGDSGSLSGRSVRGGPCEYASYEGNARIVSIIPADSTEAGERSCFAVKFEFIPDRPVTEGAFRTDKTYTLHRSDGGLPDKAFLEKRGITVGSSVRGVMKVIVKGTCTPVLFEFPGL